MKSIFVLHLLICLFLYGFGQQRTTDAQLLEYYQNQRFAEAADYLKKANPEPVTDMKILSSLAYASQMAGRLPDADQYYQRIYATDSTNVAVLFHLGNIGGRRGDNAKALVYFKKILQRDSTNFNVYQQMAGLARNMGDVASAVTYLQKANRINPADGDVAMTLPLYI